MSVGRAPAAGADQAHQLLDRRRVLGLDPVGVVGRVAEQRVRQPRLAGQHRLRPGGLPDGRHAGLHERADLRARVEARPVDVAVAAAVAHLVAGLAGAVEQRRRSDSANGRSKIQCPRPGAPGSAWSVQIEPSGSRLERKCRSSKTTSEPGASVGSSEPQTVTASERVARRVAQRDDVRRCVTWLRDGVAGQVARDVQHLDAARSVPRVTSAAPNGVATASASPPRAPAARRCPSP